MAAAVALVFAAVPALVYLWNRWQFLPPPPAPPPTDAAPSVLPPVSVLIPARNEEAVIGQSVESVLASVGLTVEVIVLDDHSTDRTAEVVRAISQRDGRVRVERAGELPAGWCGKQYACRTLARLARHDILIFLDADVRVLPDGLARMVRFLLQSQAHLVSGFPRQETGTFIEKCVIPLIHFLLLGYLPLWVSRRVRLAGFAAGCGQLFVAHRAAYESVGGHELCKDSMHDGIKLPRAYRRLGLRTDLCDATDVAVCRMYRSGGQLWHGLAKNAREGLAAPGLVVFSTAMLLLGHVLPLPLLAVALSVGDAQAAGWAAAAWGCSLAPRLDAAWRFRQSWLGAWLHPLGVLLLLAIQWYATIRAWLGRPVGWKGRPLPTRS
jgi:hypothetical protein